MKCLTIPSSGKRGTEVFYISSFGQCSRQLIVPANPQTPAQQFMRQAFGNFAHGWGGRLTQQQRDLWNAAGPNTLSAGRFEKGPLTGQQLYQGLNSARARINREALACPTAPVVFPPSPVGPFTITNGPEGVRLLLDVTGPLTEDIMLFAQAPCSQGRSKRRNVSYIGLVADPLAGIADITLQYVARFGEPRPGQKVFIVTRQQKDGWEGPDTVTSAIVPPPPTEQQAPSTIVARLNPYMYKGCTRDAEGIKALPGAYAEAGSEPVAPSAEADRPISGGLEGAGGGGGGPG